MTYHHGDLRAAILTAAAASIREHGIAALSLRALAKEVGVTHAAPRHHFGDKRGVITALAAAGYADLAAQLSAVTGGFLEVGVAYVAWAVDHPGSFQVMFRPDVVDETDADLQRTLDELRLALVSALVARGAAGADGDAANIEGIPPVGIAAWGIVHGLATLLLNGALDVAADDHDAVVDLARSTLVHLDVAQ